MTDIFVMLFQVYTLNMKWFRKPSRKTRNGLRWKYITKIEHLKFFWQTPCVHQIIHNQLSCLFLKTPPFDTQAEQQKESRALLIELIKGFFKCIYKVYTRLWCKILNIWWYGLGNWVFLESKRQNLNLAGRKHRRWCQSATLQTWNKVTKVFCIVEIDVSWERQLCLTSTSIIGPHYCNNGSADDK